MKRISLLIQTSSDNLNQITVIKSACRKQAEGGEKKSNFNDGGIAPFTQTHNISYRPCLASVESDQALEAVMSESGMVPSSIPRA